MQFRVLKNDPKLPSIEYSMLDNGITTLHTIRKLVNILSKGYSRQICETRELLARIWRGESHFSQKWPLANVGDYGENSVNGSANVGKSGESTVNGLANVGESGESSVNGLANVGESGEYLPSLLVKVGASAHDKIGHLYV
jgi:hypothetical protein